jgi:hypothetical protein
MLVGMDPNLGRGDAMALGDFSDLYWVKRNLSATEIAPYIEFLGRFERIGHSHKFVMVRVNTPQHGNNSDYYVGVPYAVHLDRFDGFEPVRWNDLPDVIDDAPVVHDRNGGFYVDFCRKFKFRSHGD